MAQRHVKTGLYIKPFLLQHIDSANAHAGTPADMPAGGETGAEKFEIGYIINIEDADQTNILV